MKTKMEVPASGEEDETPPKEWTANHGGGHGCFFDCSICLHPAGEPVVTPCGHLYCGPCMRRWMRSGHPAAHHCPVCKAAVSEDHLVRLYGRGRRPQRCNVIADWDHDRGSWVLHSNAGQVIADAAAAMLPWAFPGGRLPLPPQPVIICNGRPRKRMEDSLHQLWLFLAVTALLWFLLT